MPFLQSPSPGDREAAHSLMRINASSHATFDEILNHPTFSEGGIRDRHTSVIAVLWVETKNQPGSHAIVLDPAKTDISRATVTLPISGKVQVTLIRTAPDPGTDTMAKTLQALRINEAFHGEPLSTDSVNVIVTPNLPGTLAGQNSSSHIAIDDSYEKHGGDRLLSLMVHEVAHYYWYGNQSWMDEGISAYIAAVALSTVSGNPPRAPQWNCAAYPTIRSVPHTDPPHNCNYQRGAEMFLHLREKTTDHRTRQILRDLYRLTNRLRDEANTNTAYAGRRELESALSTQTELAVIAESFDGT